MQTVNMVLLAFSAFTVTVLAQSHHQTAHGIKAPIVPQGHQITSKGPSVNQGQGHHTVAQSHGEHDHGHAAYKFEYGVKDPHTHDIHSQSEHRDGKNIVGEYTLHEADGTQRIVKYKVGTHTGFEAIVERHGHAQHPAPHGHGKDAKGGTSYVGVTHWINQGGDEHGH